MAVKATYYNVISQLIFCGIAIITSTILPISFITKQGLTTFKYVFHFLSLELIGSLISLVIAKAANDYIIEKLKIFFLSKGFWWRTILSTVSGELIMLTIDYNITFFKTTSLINIQKLILSSMIYKAIAALVLSLPTTIIKNMVKNKIVLLKPNYHSQETKYIKQLVDSFLFR